MRLGNKRLFIIVKNIKTFQSGKVLICPLKHQNYKIIPNRHKKEIFEVGPTREISKATVYIESDPLHTRFSVFSLSPMELV